MSPHHSFDDVSDVVRRRMARVRKVDTKPELVVRRATHALGYRYRLHRRDLPGTPDLVFPASRKVIFVHGCFWHRHQCRLAGRVPQTRTEYWGPKLDRNVARDQEALAELKRHGWEALILWECEIAETDRLTAALRAFLGP